ncbi:mitogen-activated protein kinase kinase 1 [Angomonas deanei]|uniref:mitogen-activated protein kinase kinase n=1 Tax=Angomonas deanei TaxID=59799 RepID=A0A7G2C3B3_9TRYP|nr:mitogen-activated protein kinase kinase 1 [Angomonas deanei]CAD2214170.1 Protein kinase domain/Protein tyrosine kinase, putative [Angomonas deanei]|eukprot:EPY27722.1 mitogen-activated protein kinase kinase 1 [Angomonas deanei]
MMKRNLKINLDVIKDDEEENVPKEGLCEDGVRVGSLLVSSQGLTTSQGASYVLSLDDLVLVREEEGGFLGRGSSGSVRRAIHRVTGQAVALKEIKVTSQAHLSEIRRELETLHASGTRPSSQLVDFYGAFSHEGSVFIAVECLDGSLDELPKPVPLPVLSRITHGILLGLFYLHRTRHLIHRDLKPNNVLFNLQTGAVKISDFGVSSYLECTKGDANSFVGTVTYMSPERLKGEIYSYSADIWSLGLVIAELAVGACPYSGLRGE